MELTWIVILQQIFEVAIIPLLGVLTGVLIKYINSKSTEAIAAANNEQAKKYIALLDDTITSCVLATSQTYREQSNHQNRQNRCNHQQLGTIHNYERH